MIGVNGSSGVSPSGHMFGAAAADARSIAASAMGEVGGRVSAWIDRVSGGPADANNGFSPDPRELARGGDVYGLGGLARDITGQFGGTPMQEGDLRRALEDFTRQAVVQIAGLAGATDGQQLAGVRGAIATASQGVAPSGIDGVVARLTTATAQLSAMNG